MPICRISTPSRSRITLLTLAFLTPLFSAAPAPAAAADGCRLYVEMLDKHAAAEKAHQIYLKAKFPPTLEAKLRKVGLLGVFGDQILHFSRLEIQEALGGSAALTEDEWKLFSEYKDVALAAGDAAHEAAAADRAYSKEFLAKDDALAKAEKFFKEEQAWLEEQKKGLSGKPVDDAYLDQAEKILSRLRKSYDQMEADLKKYRACFPDARAFLDDLDRRRKRMNEVEQDIASRRKKPGGIAGVTALHPDRPAEVKMKPGAADPGVQPPDRPDAPAPEEKLGDVWVCKRAAIVKGDTSKFLTVDAKGFSFEHQDGDAKGIAGVRITSAPPLRVRANQKITLSATAYGDHPAYAHAHFVNNNVVATVPEGVNGCSNIEGFRAGDVTNMSIQYHFGPGENPHIILQGGRYNGQGIQIVWEYEKENP